MSADMPRPASTTTSRRRLQGTLAVLAAIPLASASREIVLGAAGVPGGSPTANPTVDSALRYANVYKAALAPIVWTQLARVERSPAVSFALVSLFAGGLARLKSWQERGRPHPVIVGAIGLELLAPPALLVWQQRIRTAENRIEKSS